MEPVGLAVGLGMGMAVGISIGIAIGRQKRPLTPEEERTQRKFVALGVALLVLLATIAGLLLWWAA
jgi:hypothetical protein